MQKYFWCLIFMLFNLSIATLSYAAGPITVDDAWVSKNGSLVTGTYIGTAANPAIYVTTKKNITIQNAKVSGPNNLISLAAGTNVTVKNTTGTGLNPNINGKFKGSFVTASRVANLIVKNCTVSGVYFGVYAVGFSGNTSSGQTINISNNIFNNIDGRASDGKGGYIIQGYTKQPHAHAIQLNKVLNVPNIVIAWNQSINKPFQGMVNDIINIYSSSGTPSSHILVRDNYIQGALGSNPGNGESYSGGGIITDGYYADTATTTTAYVDIYNNQVVQTANYGVAIAAGNNNRIFKNRVISSGLLNGKLYVMTYANAANNANLQKQATTTYFNNYVYDNVLGLIRKNKTTGTAMRSDWYLPGQKDSGNNQHFSPNNSSSPTSTDENNEFTAWKKKLIANGIVIGA